MELGSLEVIEAAFAELSLAASSLGSRADKYEQADATQATAEAQMGRGCTLHRRGHRGSHRNSRGPAGQGRLGAAGCTGSCHGAAAAPSG